ncbi:hypothetical protein [Heliophilum fasciatum]|uniref:Uncharacterized protein n=1 Tax=Heliophilum fasciatum TaxID=35700 RepID=A0A4R2RWW1_9FIRM|nr:hypothetical protein [Heliophilum fasciatum]MCW2276657.1 hypothetical protein [Heliophilum fasciatum]TCP68962.1 hypothetical protein EDD73_101128 [Heliophilum fasciatum]
MIDRWVGWPWERTLVLFTSLAFALLAVQVTLFHYRQNFRHWAMWGPVIGLPIAALLGFLLVAKETVTMRLLFILALWLELGSSLLGIYFHGRGVGQRVGGWGLHNIMIGPPLILPMMLSALSVLGLLAMYW